MIVVQPSPTAAHARLSWTAGSITVGNFLENTILIRSLHFDPKDSAFRLPSSTRIQQYIDETVDCQFRVCHMARGRQVAAERCHVPHHQIHS